MRFVHDHHRPVEFQQIRKRVDGPRTAINKIKPDHLRFCQGAEMVHQHARIFIDFQAFGVFLAAIILSPEGLNGGNNHNRPARGIGPGHGQGFRLVHNRKIAIEGFQQGRAVSVALILKRHQGLIQDRG